MPSGKGYLRIFCLILGYVDYIMQLFEIFMKGEFSCGTEIVT